VPRSIYKRRSQSLGSVGRPATWSRSRWL